MELETDYYDLGGDGIDHLRAIGTYLEGVPLEQALLELVKVRASQLNGCAHCLAMHIETAREEGIDESRLETLAAWRESSHFTARERAALAWTDALTRLPEGVPSDVREAVDAAFTERERVQLTLSIGVINAWNRLAVAFRRPAVADG